MEQETATVVQLGITEIVGAGGVMAVLYAVVTKVIGPLINRLPLPGTTKLAPDPYRGFSKNDKHKLGAVHELLSNAHKFNVPPWQCEAYKNTPLLEEIRDGIQRLNDKQAAYINAAEIISGHTGPHNTPS